MKLFSMLKSANQIGKNGLVTLMIGQIQCRVKFYSDIFIGSGAVLNVINNYSDNNLRFRRLRKAVVSLLKVIFSLKFMVFNQAVSLPDGITGPGCQYAALFDCSKIICFNKMRHFSSGISTAIQRCVYIPHSLIE